MADVKVRQAGYNATQARQDQAETLDRNIPFPWRSGKLITGLALVPGQQLRVSHGLKRAVKGWVLVRPRNTSGAAVFEVQPSSTNKGNTLTLAATGSIAFDLWVW